MEELGLLLQQQDPLLPKPEQALEMLKEMDWRMGTGLLVKWVMH